ncbi:cytochrome P450 2K4-like [Paroedura picta]|uniref:cytochrome P450 2K4-like n=1 Tax=Paroedura picta TaxID=143630 RepID=UPI004056493E
MDWIDPLSIFFLFVLAITFLWKTGAFWNGSSQNVPPGPRPFPLIGNLHLMDLKKPYQTMCKLSKQYGPVFRLQLGSQKMVVLTGYETVKEALVNQAEAFAERPFVPMFEEVVEGHGVIFAHGENWKVMRRFTLTTLRDYGMGKKTIEDRIIEECGFLIKKFESYEGKPFENTKIMNAAVANIIVSILLAKRFEYDDPTFLRLLSLINENVQLAASPSVQLYNMFPSLGFLLGARKKVLNNRDELFVFIKATFIEHLKELDANDQRSLIDSFLIRQQEEKNKTNGFFHNENLAALVANLFGAGTETTSTTLRWAILLMMKYPEIQKKVQEEIAQVVGSAQPRTEHRAKMPYTDAVIHEIQRFGNIVPTNLPHATTVDVTLKGYFIPKGMYIIPLLSSVLQDETQWEKPLKFYPEHFLDSDGKFVKRDAFMPFSAGRRMCAGENLAKMELFLFFTSLLQKFTFQQAPGMSKEDLNFATLVALTALPVPYMCCALSRC